MFDIHSEIGIERKCVDRLISDMQKKHEEILMARLKELGIEIDTEKDKNRRFKRFSKEINGDETTYYFDDGSLDGLRIITFVLHNDTMIDPDKRSIVITYKYY